MTWQKWVAVGCGIVTLIVSVIVCGVLVWLFTSPDGGVRTSNEIEPYAVEYLKANRILNESEDIIVYYDVTIILNSTEAAILTTDRIIYHKAPDTFSINLEDIADINHYQESLTGDVFEIESVDGQLMKIEVAPLNGGETFKNALMNAWERSGQ